MGDITSHHSKGNEIQQVKITSRDKSQSTSHKCSSEKEIPWVDGRYKGAVSQGKQKGCELPCDTSQSTSSGIPTSRFKRSPSPDRYGQAGYVVAALLASKRCVRSSRQREHAQRVESGEQRGKDRFDPSLQRVYDESGKPREMLQLLEKDGRSLGGVPKKSPEGILAVALLQADGKYKLVLAYNSLKDKNKATQ